MVLKKQVYDRKRASSAQVSALESLNLIPAEAKQAIDEILAQDPEEAPAGGFAVSAPEANACEFQSHGVIEMLEKMLDKFIDERATLKKEEVTARHAFDMLIQDLKAQIKQAPQDRDEKSENPRIGL